MDRAKLSKRLRLEGRLEEADAFRIAEIKRFRREGLKQIEARERAWESMDAKFPPLPPAPPAAEERLPVGEPLHPAFRDDTAADRNAAPAGPVLDLDDIRRRLTAIESTLLAIAAKLESTQGVKRRGASAEHIVSAWSEEYLPELEGKAGIALEEAIEQALAG